MSLKRAAFIAEMDDGTRMIYELHEPLTMTIEHVSGRHEHITIDGTLVRGTVWHGDMPTTTPAELTTGQKEIPA